MHHPRRTQFPRLGRRLALIALTLIALAAPTLAQPAPAPTDPLTVGIGGAPPFLISTDETYQGLVPDLWERIALINDYDYEFVLQTNTQDALNAVATGELDLLVGPFSITAERLETVNFTRPFFVSSIGVLLPQELPSLWSRLRPFFTTAALSSVGALLISLFIVGNAMWLAERRQNPDQFAPDYLPGIGSGMWFALVTLTTVGYGDRAPATPLGRLIASVWMLISLIAVSSLIGGLATAFTLALSRVPADAIASPDDLRGTRMAVVADSTGEVWAADYQARLIRQPDLQQAIDTVVAGNADGVVFDRPALEYYLSQNPDLNLRLASFGLNSENFGFVIPYGSPLTQPINLAIVQLRENGTLDTLSRRWLQGIEPPSASP